MALKVAIAGMGSRGRAWVREVNHSSSFELAACIDVDQKRLHEAAAHCDIPARCCFDNLTQAFEQTNCDAVIVATSIPNHIEPCEAALSRRIPVLVEKPLAVTLREAFAIVSLAERQNTPLLVGQNFRYMRAFRTVKTLIGEGVLGRIGMINCHYYAPPHQMASSLAELQNSVLWGMAIHHLDALRYMLKTEATGVMADSFSLPWGALPRGASLRLLLSFADGTRATYSATYESSGHQFFERGQQFYARFIGERATLHVFQRWLVLCENGKLPRLVRRGKRAVTEEQILLDQLQRAVVKGEAGEVSGRDNLQTMAIAEACLRSAAEQKWVNPQELLNEFD